MTRFKPFARKKWDWEKVIETYEAKFGKKPLKIINDIIRKDFPVTRPATTREIDPLTIENNIFTQFLYLNDNDAFMELNDKTNFNELKEEYFKPFIQFYITVFPKEINKRSELTFEDKYNALMADTILGKKAKNLYELGKLYSYPVKKTYKNFSGIFDSLLSCYEKLIKNNYYFSYQVDKQRVSSPLDDYDIYNYLIENPNMRYNFINILDVANVGKSKSFLEKIKSAFKKDEKKLDNKYILTSGDGDNSIILFVVRNKDNIMIRSIGKELMETNRAMLNTNAVKTNTESYIDIINILPNGKKIMIQCVSGNKGNNKNRIDEIVIDGKDIRINEKRMYGIVKFENKITITRGCYTTGNLAEITAEGDGGKISITNFIIPFEVVLVFVASIVVLSDFNKILKEIEGSDVRPRPECQNEYVVSEYKRMLVKKIEMDM